jgi:hypothetical protein
MLSFSKVRCDAIGAAAQKSAQDRKIAGNFCPPMFRNYFATSRER